MKSNIKIELINKTVIELYDVNKDELNIQIIDNMIVQSKVDSTGFIRFTFKKKKDILIQVDKIISIIEEF